MVKESSAGDDVARLAHVVELEKLDVIRPQKKIKKQERCHNSM